MVKQGNIGAVEFDYAKCEAVKIMQAECFSQEVKTLKSGKKVKYYSEGGQSAYSWTIASNLKESGLNGLNSGQEK